MSDAVDMKGVSTVHQQFELVGAGEFRQADRAIEWVSHQSDYFLVVEDGWSVHQRLIEAGVVLPEKLLQVILGSLIGCVRGRGRVSMVESSGVPFGAAIVESSLVRTFGLPLPSFFYVLENLSRNYVIET